jgi:hypothetical protein
MCVPPAPLWMNNGPDDPGGGGNDIIIHSEVHNSMQDARAWVEPALDSAAEAEQSNP